MLNLQNPNTSLVILLFTFFVSWVLTMIGAFPLLLVMFFVLLFVSVIVEKKHQFLVMTTIYMNVAGIFGGFAVLYIAVDNIWSAL